MVVLQAVLPPLIKYRHFRDQDSGSERGEGKGRKGKPELLMRDDGEDDEEVPQKSSNEHQCVGGGVEKNEPGRMPQLGRVEGVPVEHLGRSSLLRREWEEERREGEGGQAGRDATESDARVAQREVLLTMNEKGISSTRDD